MPDIYRIAAFGPRAVGLQEAHYTLLAPDGTTVVRARQAVAVVAVADAPGVYGATLDVPAGFAGTIAWDTGGDDPARAYDDVDRPVAATVPPPEGGTPGPASDALEAVQSYFLARPALVAAVDRGRLYYAEAPEGTALPYATYFEVADVEDDTTGDPTWRRVTVQFSLHASSAAGARALGRLFSKKPHGFNRAPLVIGGRPAGHCRRIGGLLAQGEGKGPQGEDCWIQTLDYEIAFADTQ